MRILCANWEAQDNADLEHSLFPDVEFVLHPVPATPADALPADLCRSVDAVVSYSPNSPLSAPPSAFERCRIVVRAGVGFDSIDRDGFGRLGVPVCNVPDYGTTEVADHALGLMVSLRRGIASYDEAIRSRPDGWHFSNAPLVRRLKSRVFGVVGLGRIGLAAARRAAGFDMKVMFYDPHLSNGVELSTGYERVHSLAELMAASDVVSIHAPLDASTRGLIDAAALRAAKPGLVLINTARGPIVDLDALADALRASVIAGAGLDVLPGEPADFAHPLLAAWKGREAWIEGRLILTPHAAFYSPESLIDLRRKSIEVVVDYVRDGRLTNCVNRETLPAKLRSAA